MKNEAAVALGSICTEKKSAAARVNGKKGGRPKLPLTTYIVRESDILTFHREGERIEAKNLADAKRLATRRQFYQGTNLRIESETGSILAIKMDGYRWVNVV